MTWSKRLFDLVLAVVLLVVLLPVLLGLCFLVLALDGWPVFYTQERMQTRTRAFRLIKFRTMRLSGQDSGVSGGDKNTRITRLGGFLRRSRLDETPQLWNILKGDMSFVGPRPPLREYVEIFPQLYASVLQSRPGVTGLASLTFHRHEERLLRACKTAEETNAVYARRCIPRKAVLDQIYQKNQSLCGDLVILLRTFLDRLRPHRVGRTLTPPPNMLQNIKLAVLVVFYHPNPSDIGLLTELRNADMPSYLIDNTPDGGQTSLLTDTDKPFVWIHRGSNIGLSRAFNQGFNRARSDGFTHVLVLDQDTRITQQSLYFMAENLARQPQTGMLNFGQRGPETASQCKARLLVINSATVFDLDCHSVVNGFNERYFVDCVDYDYCWRCLKADRPVYQILGTPGLDHLTGQPGQSLQIFGKTIFARSYGKSRNAEILYGHLNLLWAGIIRFEGAWSWAILRSLILFAIGRVVTFVTLRKQGKS